MPPWVLALRLSGLGFYIVICIVGGIVGGVLLDNALNTKVIFLLVGLLLGSVSAFYGTYKMVAPLLDPNGLDEPKHGRED